MLARLVDLFSFFSVVLRAGTLVSQSLLLGGIAFLLWIERSSPEVSAAELEVARAAASRLLRISALALALVQLMYLYVNSAVLMTTAEIGLDEVVGAGFFVAGSIVLVGAVGAAVFAVGTRERQRLILPALAAVVMAGSVMTNHAASRLEGRLLLVALSCVHEIAVGFWVGGLPYLIFVLCRTRNDAVRWYLTTRFSLMATISVGALAVSGVAMGIKYVGSWGALLGTSYGTMLNAKTVMFGALLLLGGLNHRLIHSFPRGDALPRLRRLIEAELGIGITVVLTAASLTAQPPAIDQVADTVTAAQIYRRFKPQIPRFGYEYVAEAAAVDAHAASETVKPLAYNVDGIPLTVKVINYAIESESNHHWMGLVVLTMGILALLARTGRARWAEFWPLLLIGIALFIFFQADSECWPVGWKGFWACWIAPESFQHRIAALLCATFGIFELRVRRRREENDRRALVFPLICALGGAVLLTHSHTTVNIKESTLVEWSHVPMGVLAVFAGWTRWLELRLPRGERALASWTWPLCFVLIGLMLLNYREMNTFP